MLYLNRDEFLADYWDYQPGEHVNVISPTGGGKTHLLYQLARETRKWNPELHPVSMMPKPSDPSTVAWSKELGLKETDIWPPARWPWQAEPAGHVLWPKHIKNDEAANRAHLTSVFRGCFNQQYWRGNSITIADDAYLLGVIYGLNQELDRHWIAGRSNGAAVWTTLQKPSGTKDGAVSSFAYDAPTHLFLGRDNDQRNLKRLSEISVSTVDAREIESVVRNLKVHRINGSAVSEMLYLNRRGPWLAVIGV